MDWGHKGWIGAFVLAMLVSSSANGSEPSRLHVSVSGKDTWSGRLAGPNPDGSDGPLASLEAARDAIRVMKREGKLGGGAVVEIRRGIYLRDKTFELTRDDTGSDAAPIAYQAAAGEEVRLIGGKPVSKFVPVADPAVLDRLCPEARGKVMQSDLKAQGIGDNEIARIHAPIGLDIGAISPPEIAVSIMAEITLRLRVKAEKEMAA